MITSLTNKSDIDAYLAKNPNKKIALVPTMGNLHAGHLNLMTIAKQHADIVIASIFVNPTQFGVNEDLDNYPRTLDADLTQLETVGVDAVFTPREVDIYPNGKDNTLNIFIPNMMEILCATDRPTHFQGVAIVVLKLFQLIRPDYAVFGEKDFQQLAIIKKLVSELFIDIEILSAPITRDNFGLALSSRNQYLNPKELDKARCINKILQETKEQLIDLVPPKKALKNASQKINNLGIKLEYLDLRNQKTLELTEDIHQAMLFIGARIGQTRLIDNLTIFKINQQESQ